jgi:hypothetical protein
VIRVLPQQALMIVLEFTCIALALALVYLSLKVCNTKRSIYLLGLPFGFFFLMISYTFLSLHLVNLTTSTLQSVTPLSSSLMWLRVVTQTIGIGLIAFLYLFASRYQHITKINYLRILAGSTILILVAFGALYFFNPLNITSIYHDTGLFSLLNLILLSFITCLLVRKVQFTPQKHSGLLGAPVAFFCLWLGQLFFLIFGYAGGGVVALIASQIARVVSLALFIGIYYVANKEVSTYAGEQTEQS